MVRHLYFLIPFSMSLTRQIAHNTLIQIVGKVISTVIGLVVAVILLRYLGTTGFGHYTTVIAFLQFFSIIVDLGLYIILIQKISQPDADVDRLVTNAFSLRLVTAIVILGLAPFLVLFFPYSGDVKTGVALASLSFLFIAASQVLSGVFQKALRMDLLTLAEVVGRLALLGGTLVVVGRGGSLLAVLATVVIGSLLNLLFTLVWVRKFVRLRWEIDFAVWKDIMKDAWPIAVSIAPYLIYFKADTIILSLFRPAADVGIYGATYKVLEVLAAFPAMFAGLIMPILSNAFARHDHERFQRVLQRSFDSMLLLAVPLVIVTEFTATGIMSAVDSRFIASGHVLQIIIIATGSIFIGTLFGNAVVAINRQRSMIAVYLIVAIVALTGYFLTIPRFGYFGAAWMTVVSELLMTVLAARLVLRKTGSRLHFGVAGRVLAAGAVMAFVLWVSREFPWPALLALGTATYAAGVIGFRAMSLATIKEIVQLRR